LVLDKIAYEVSISKIETDVLSLKPEESQDLEDEIEIDAEEIDAEEM
jgi:hypothetical protein